MRRFFSTPWRTIVVVIGIVYACAFLYVSVFDASIFSDRGYPIHNGGDSGEYATLAENLVEYGTFSLTLYPRVPEMFRTPGYPLFLAPLYAIDHSFILAILIQVVLVIASALLIYAIGAQFLPAPWPFLAALFFALDPTTIFYSLSLWSDTLFTFLLLLAVYLFAQEKKGWRTSILLGLTLGAAALVRSSGEYLVVMFTVFVFVEGVRRIGWKRSLVAASLVLLASFAVVCPWFVRNYHESDAWGLSTTGPYTILFYHVKDFVVQRGTHAADFDERVRETLHVDDLSELRNITYASAMTELVKTYIGADPINYGVYHSLGVVNFFLSSSMRDLAINLPVLARGLTSLGLMSDNAVSVKALFAESPVRALWYAASAEPLLTLERLARFGVALLTMVGVFMLFVRKRMTILFALCIALVLYIAIIIGPVSYPRYRMPAEPFLLLTAATGASLLLRAKMGV